jgi:hypothetical protein
LQGNFAFPYTGPYQRPATSAFLIPIGGRPGDRGGRAMFEGLIYWHRIRKCQSNLEASHTKAGARIKNLASSAETLSDIIQDEMSERDLIFDQIALLQTQRLLEQAQHYLVPIPSNEIQGNIVQHWVQSKISGRFWLTPKSMVDLRALIRAEQKDRWDFWSRWVPIVFGLIGATTGLVSMLRR